MLVPFRALVAVSILIGAGCADIPQPLKIYDGPVLPTQAVALIEGEEPQPSESPQRFDTGGVYIPCMDRVSLERNFGGYDNNARWPNKLIVTPGRHYLAVVYSIPRGQKAWWATVALDAEAGRRYMVRKEVTGKEIASASVRMWVEDAANGMTVASAMPMDLRRDAVKPCP
jgi:hypothetical protein